MSSPIALPSPPPRWAGISIHYEELEAARALGYQERTPAPLLRDAGCSLRLDEHGWVLVEAGETCLLAKPYLAEAWRLCRFIEFTAQAERALEGALAAMGLDVQSTAYGKALRAIAREFCPAEWVEVFPPAFPGAA